MCEALFDVRYIAGVLNVGFEPIASLPDRFVLFIAIKLGRAIILLRTSKLS